MTSATRRRFLQSATTGLAAASLEPVAAASQGAALPPRNFRTVGAPVVQAPTGTEATIAWGVNDTSTGWVEYGETEPGAGGPGRWRTSRSTARGQHKRTAAPMHARSGTISSRPVAWTFSSPDTRTGTPGLPPDASRPFGQLSGGGPQLDGATLIQGRATSRALHMVMQTPAGATLWEQTFSPRG